MKTNRRSSWRPNRFIQKKNKTKTPDKNDSEIQLVGVSQRVLGVLWPKHSSFLNKMNGLAAFSWEDHISHPKQQCSCLKWCTARTVDTDVNRDSLNQAMHREKVSHGRIFSLFDYGSLSSHRLTTRSGKALRWSAKGSRFDPLRLSSPSPSKLVAYGHCLETLPTQSLKHSNLSHSCPPEWRIILVVTV